MAVCLVIGGAGFLGSHLVEALVADRHVARVADNFTTGKLQHLAGVMSAVELYPGDCLDQAFLSRVMRGVELVFHLGASPGPGDPDCPPHAPGGGDAGATSRVLSAALQARVRRVLFASSGRVHGGHAPRPVEESQTAEPGSPYGRAKLSGERACAVWTRTTGLETVCLRYFNVFGPRQPENSPYAAVVHTSITAMLAGRSPILPGEAGSEQDLIYVEDAVHATLLAARSARVAGKVYNIARGQPTSSWEVVATLNDLLGTNIEAVYTGPPGRGALNTLANVRRAEVELGFCAATDLRRGLSRCLHARSGKPRGGSRRPRATKATSNGLPTRLPWAPP
jgi:UDP-glucose 4-epimerase